MSKNNTSTGGFLQPNPQPPALVTTPPGLPLIDFLQTVFVGLSGFNGTLVRPEWQPEPPKNPDLEINWMAFGIGPITPDSNAYVDFDSEGNPMMQRNELLQIACSVYGPAAYDNAGLIRDGFQLTQNLTSLKTANMGFAYDSPAQHVPDYINGRFIDRFTMDIFLRRQIQRFYPILTFISATGTIYTQTAVDENYSLNWKAGS